MRKSFFLLFSLLHLTLFAVEIERFEYFNTEKGLSQNAAICLHCDTEGYLWVGTMNGLNRYDGYQFKIYTTADGLSSNRIASIREDDNGFLWVKTYEGYMHCFNKEKETFTTYPFFHKNDEEKNSLINSFLQTDMNNIWLGSSNSGLYHLTFNSKKNDYSVEQFFSRGNNTITNNTVTFVIHDSEKNIWIGTSKGLNLINQQENESKIQHFLIDYTVSKGVSVGKYVWFGTKNEGIFIYNQITGAFEHINVPSEMLRTTITHFEVLKNGNILVGTDSEGCFVYDYKENFFRKISTCHLSIRNFFQDKYGIVWIASQGYGVDKYDYKTDQINHFELSPRNMQSLIDDERLRFYEDHESTLWISCHGGGLARYKRGEDSFTYYRYNPEDPKSIGSNFIQMIIQDKANNYWLGTSQSNSGVNRAIFQNPAFKHIVPNSENTLLAENIVRALHEDSRGNIWVATKYGQVYIYNQDLKNINIINVSVSEQNVRQNNNVYAFYEDENQHMWLGTKGGGIFITKKPINNYKSDYKDIAFTQFRSGPEDSNSLIDDRVYSIVNDKLGQKWVGTYANGISLIKGTFPGDFEFVPVHSGNTNLSNNFVRNVFCDSQGNLWVATVLGLNLLTNEQIEANNFEFRVFLNDPNDQESISYNDIIHIYEDSNQNIWIATFGGGINKMFKDENGEYKSQKFSKIDGLSSEIIHGILEDNNKNLWFSTENRLNLFIKDENRFEVFNEPKATRAQNFSENTCLKLKNGELIFGSIYGFVVVQPDKITEQKPYQNLVFNNFQLSNKDVGIGTPNSPLSKSIQYTEELTLFYTQTSFSFEFSALNLTAPEQIHYAFQLENYENEWNYAGSVRKAVYRNIPPGTYTFKVKATNLKGEWSPNEKHISIKILPPWWKTNLAYIIYLIFGLFLFEISRRGFTKYQHLQTDLKVEKRINEIKLKFFTNISHEIRTPLTLILGPLEDLKKSKHLLPAISRPIEIMDRNGRRMLRLVNQLLDFRKMQNKKMQLKVQKTDVVVFVINICKNFTELASHKNIEFVFPAHSQNIEAWFDIEKMDSVLFNLLSNAFKFTSSGKSIKVEVFIDEIDGAISIKISDKGKGIPKEKLDLVFQRFTTMASENIDFNGTGIGLAYSYELVKLHHGDILVDSQVGKGSVFTIKLKQGVAHFKPEDLVPNESDKNILSHKNEYSFSNIEVSENRILPNEKKEHTVLIVEDNPEVQYYIASVLVKFYHIVTAENGFEGLKQIHKIHPDLIITDLMMPEMDGITMTKTIKNDFSISHIPVVMLTAKSTLDDQMQGIGSGAEAYVLKPFNAEYLIVVVGNLIKQRSIILRKFQNQLPLNDDIKITNKDEEFLNKIIRIIEEKCPDSNFNVEQLVKECSHGRTVFYNKIKGLTGLSPVEFLRKIRLNIASKYLKEHGYGIAEAAYLSGFNDVKYFSRCFKKEFDDLPSVFKKKFQK